MNKKLFILLIISILFLTSCEYFKLLSYNEWEDQNKKEKIVIYSVGYYLEGGNYHACYWKSEDNDIKKIDLPGDNDSTARSIFILNNNIYIAGFFNDSGVQRACYWINDDLNPLEVTSGTTSSSATSIIKINSDILIACVAKDRTGGTEDTIKKFKKFYPQRQIILV